MSPRILIVDDDPVGRRLLEDLVRRFGYAVEALDGGEAALGRLARSGEAPVDLLILDLVMPDLDGMGVLGAMRARGLKVPAIVQTARGSIEAVTSALRAGAVDFVVKPAGAERLKVAIQNALRTSALEAEVRRLDGEASRALAFKELAAASPEMERVLRLAERAAKSTLPILFEGEPGAGKDALARAVHGASDRRGRPFVVLHCAGLADESAGEILFGQDREAGAGEKRPGKFGEAQGGSLFLDEIGALPLAAQARLARALQEGDAGPAGGRRAARFDVRLLCATSANLIEAVKAGRFREDLYYRINVFPIAAPPLRRRASDVVDLARRFCARFSAAEGKRLRGLTAEALALLSAYDWPGNVRQLENAVFRAVALADGDELTVAEFPQIAARVAGFGVRVPPAPAGPRAPRETEVVRVEVRDPNVLPLLDERGDMRRLDDLEAAAIRFALDHDRGQMSAAARRLGIGRSTLYRKMKIYGLADHDDFGGAQSQAGAEPLISPAAPLISKAAGGEGKAALSGKSSRGLALRASRSAS